MRKLVTVQKIKEILPIEGADLIEVVKILGWSVVTKKGEFRVGDKVVYAEIDSLFPNKPEFQFLEKVNYRIKTIKLRGQISQGICFPLSILPPGDYSEGDEVTDVLGVTKYEPKVPACLEGKVKGSFPGFIPKTDETRVQTLQGLLTKYKGMKCYYSEKLDGSSSTFYLYDGEFGVCSRNIDILEDEDNVFWQIAKKYDIENKLRSLGLTNIAIQGEIIGDTIQKNKYKLKTNERKLYIFNVFDIEDSKYLHFNEMLDIAEALGIPTAPILDTDFELIDDIDKLVELSKGFSMLNPKIKREGIVIRPLKEIVDVRHGRLSFKAINPEFLLKYGDE